MTNILKWKTNCIISNNLTWIFLNKIHQTRNRIKKGVCNYEENSFEFLTKIINLFSTAFNDIYIFPNVYTSRINVYSIFTKHKLDCNTKLNIENNKTYAWFLN